MLNHYMEHRVTRYRAGGPQKAKGALGCSEMNTYLSIGINRDGSMDGRLEGISEGRLSDGRRPEGLRLAGKFCMVKIS